MSRSEHSSTAPSGLERCCEVRKEPEKWLLTWQISGGFLRTSCFASSCAEWFGSCVGRACHEPFRAVGQLRAGSSGAARPERNPKRGSRHSRFQAGSRSEQVAARLSCHEPFRTRFHSSEWARAVPRGLKRARKVAPDMADLRRVLARNELLRVELC